MGLPLLLLLATGCSRTPAPPPPAARHLVLVTIDTLRADRLGCYGNREVQTPHLDRIAASGAVMTDASAHVPLTRPSHVSLFTGLYPAEHGIRDNVSPSLDESVPTLPAILSRSGFRTAAFVSSVVLSSQSGLARGFDTYSDRFEMGEDDARFLNTIQKRGDQPTAEAVSWLEGHAGKERLFLWLHLYDPHDPYQPPEPYASRYPGRPYDGEVAWSDELVGRLDGALDRLGLRKDTLLVVTSDHGEGLGEHGEAVHGYFVYETTLRVPLIFRGPGVKDRQRLGAAARTVDLLPTLLDLLGVDRSPTLQLPGRSLASALRGGAAARSEAVYAESLLPLLHFGWSDLRALRDGRFKYIQAPKPELYDLEADPREERNLVSAEPARVEALRTALAGWLAAEKKRTAAGATAASVPEEMLEKLGALGYLGAGTAPARTTGADPKDKLEEYKVVNRLMREALVALREERPRDSISRFRDLIGRKIDSFEVHYYLARALAQTRQPRQAAQHFERSIERLPGYGAAYVGLADARVALGDAKGALSALERGARAAPKDSRIPQAQAGLWRRMERPAEAIRAYEAAMALAPKNALVKVQLGEMYRDRGRLDEAIALMRQAVTLDPETSSYWNSLGMVLGAKGDLAEAEKAFGEALRRDPNDAQYCYNLGLALQRQGRGERATEHFRRALSLRPDFTAARERLRELQERRRTGAT